MRGGQCRQGPINKGAPISNPSSRLIATAAFWDQARITLPWIKSLRQVWRRPRLLQAKIVGRSVAFASTIATDRTVRARRLTSARLAAAFATVKRLTGATAPRFPASSVTSAQDYMDLFSNNSDLGISTCKFHAMQFDVFTDVVKLLRNHAQLHNITILNAGLNSLSRWNEINLNFDARDIRRVDAEDGFSDRKEADVYDANAAHEDVIIGVYYMDVDSMDTQSRKENKKAAQEMVRAYNRRHSKQINMFRIISEKDDKYWQFGSRAKLSEYMRLDPDF